MRRRLLLCLICLAAAAAGVAGPAAPARAWGTVGHRIVCQIAYQELVPAARAAVDRLIALDPAYANFSDSCVWADRTDGRGDEHYVTVPRDFRHFTRIECPEAERCVLTAIGQDVAVLKSAADDRAKLAALKFLGHWAADIHQPVHVVFDDDEGGHRIRTRGVCHDFDFHDVWDACILHLGIGTDVPAIADWLRGRVDDAERAAWRAAPVWQWANESFDVLRRPATGYCVQVGDRCQYTADNPTFDEDSYEPEKVVAVDEAYIERFAPTIAGRLTRAGIRLGGLLNGALGAGRPAGE